MGKKVIIVGGVAGGASAATRLRRLDENAEIIMFERGEHISFANCGLPYYIGGVIKDRDDLLVQTAESMKSRFNIDVRVRSEVIKVDTDNNKVTVKSDSKGIYEETYDYLVLSPGAKAIKPGIPGINSSKIFTLRNVADTDAIKDYIDNNGVSSVVVAGGGFVGVEMAENLKLKGINVSVVEAAPHILAPFDRDIVVTVEKELVKNGINLVLGDGVKEFSDTENGISVVLNSGKTLAADMVILSIGIIPDTEFIKDSGIELGPKGHIIVNEKMQTNIENIYAVGDAVEVTDFVTGLKTAVQLAGPANKQGRIAADNISGLKSVYRGAQGTAIIKVFDLTAAVTGANERALERAGISYRKIFIHPASHASYYPGALPMTLKLLFDDSGKILGAQCVGYKGVDKRIDVIAAAIRFNGTVHDLADLELSYAPPYSSAKDPVNMAGYVAQNALLKKTNIITWDEVGKLDKDDYILLDVRTEREFKRGHVEGAVNIPLDSLRDRIHELDKSKIIVTYCKVGIRGYIAERILTQKGFKVFNVTGGYTEVERLR
ncbi:MAG: CoA-disulfide reductase [Clostridiaceae bacterium]|nr:CoA-disulfide reductase [Clostridiaceae bacterium]